MSRAANGSRTAPGAPARGLEKLRILVVDDEGICRQWARMLLESEGASVTEAGDGAQAVAVCLGSAPKVDLVLMDQQMPLLGGLAATAAIRRRFSAQVLPIIGLSSNCDAEDRCAALDAGMNEYLPKPFDLDRVLSAIHRHRRS